MVGKLNTNYVVEMLDPATGRYVEIVQRRMVGGSRYTADLLADASDRLWSNDPVTAIRGAAMRGTLRHVVHVDDLVLAQCE